MLSNGVGVTALKYFGTGSGQGGMPVKIEKSFREMYSGEMLLREFQAELNRALAAHPGQHFVVDMLDVLRTALYVLISVPFYVIASLALAAATYVRLAGALLAE
jgi:hypothetical protein